MTAGALQQLAVFSLVYPFLLQLEHPIHLWVHSYDAFIGLAVIVCFVVGPRWAFALEGLDPAATRRIMLILCVATFAGGHVQYLINAWRFVLFRASTGDIGLLLVWGIHAPGAVLGLVLAGLLTLRWYRVPAGRFGDGLVPTVGLGIAIARIGCFLNGCCYGTPCTWPWCIVFPEGSSAWNQHRFFGLIPLDGTHSAPVHPLQLYFSAVGLLITAVALWLHPRKRYDGQVTLVALVIFCATSAALEELRAPFALRAYWRGIPQLSWVLFGMTVASICALLVAEFRHSRSVRTAAAPLPT